LPPGSLINAVLSMVTSHGLIAPHCDGFEVSGLALNCIASKINLTFAPGNEWDLLNFFQMDYMHCDSANPWYYYEWIYRCWTRGIVWFDVRMSLVFSCRFYDSIFIVWSCPHAFIFLKKIGAHFCTARFCAGCTGAAIRNSRLFSEAHFSRGACIKLECFCCNLLSSLFRKNILHLLFPWATHLGC